MRLQVNWVVSDTVVEGKYEIVNDSSEPAMVFTHLFHQQPSGAREVAPYLVYTSIDKEGSLLVEKVVPHVPFEIDVECPVVPFAEMIPPGSVSFGEIRLSVPVAAFQAYPPRIRSPLPSHSRFIQLRIGYLTTLSNEAVGAKIDCGAMVLYSVVPTLALARQKIITTDRVPLVVPLG